MDYVPALQIAIPALISAVLEMWPRLKVKWDKLTASEKKFVILALVGAMTLAGHYYRCVTGHGCPQDWSLLIEQIVLEFLVGIGVVQGVHRIAKKKVPNETVS